jgi:hypothetical protein
MKLTPQDFHECACAAVLDSVFGGVSGQIAWCSPDGTFAFALLVDLGHVAGAHRTESIVRM